MALKQLRSLSQALPQPVRFGARRLMFTGTGHTCDFCGSSVRALHGHGGGHEVLDRRKVVGGMRREADRCPVCHSCDRTRMIKLYLEEHVDLSAATPLKVLHIAPEYGLYLWLKRQPGLDYVPSDLDLARYRHIPGIVEADLTKLPFADREFDLVICSHVLEHVPDDRKAMSEILRVLKPEGRALLLVPFATDGLPTDEEPELTDIDERLRRFGQWDHIRLYARDDFVARLSETGLDVSLFTPFTSHPEAAKALSLNPLEVLPVATRPREAA